MTLESCAMGLMIRRQDFLFCAFCLRKMCAQWGVYMCSSVCLVFQTTCSISMKLFSKIWRKGYLGTWMADSVWWLGFGLDDGDIVVRFPAGTKDFSPLQSFYTGGGAHAVFFLGAFRKLQKATITFVMSVRPSGRPRGTTVLPLDGFSWNFVSEYLSKICRENSSYMKIWQE